MLQTRTNGHKHRVFWRSHATAFAELQLLRCLVIRYDIVLEQELCQGHLDFQQRESLSNTDPRTESEWHVDSWMPFDVGLESERVELVHVLAPVFGVEMKREDIHDDGHVLSEFDAVELARLGASSCNDT